MYATTLDDTRVRKALQDELCTTDLKLDKLRADVYAYRMLGIRTAVIQTWSTEHVTHTVNAYALSTGNAVETLNARIIMEMCSRTGTLMAAFDVLHGPTQIPASMETVYTST